MARVIKKGRCSFTVLSTNGSDCSVSSDETGNCDDFSSLSHLLPEDTDSKTDEQVEGAKRGGPGNTDRLYEAKKEAEEIVSRAKAEAERLKSEAEIIVVEARKNAEEIESQAYALGYEQGQKDGKELGIKQYQVAIQHLERLLKSFKEETARLSSAYEAQMVQICLLVAKAIIEKEVSEDSELIKRVLSKALDRTIEGSSVTVLVNPRDLEGLDEEFLESLSTPGGNIVKLKADAQVSRGGCMIETDFGLVDATMESRWLCLMEDINRQIFERTGFNIKDPLKTFGVDEKETK